ncbi:MAG: hypothetical protein AABX32_03865 [Nanoarchaeota archaeon]
MEAFIGLTSDDWFDYHIDKKHDKVVFWTNRLIHLQNDSKFLFLCGIGQKDRYISGYGVVEEVRTCTVNDLWNKFGNLCGADSIEELAIKISGATTNKLIGKDDKISYYFIANFKPFTNWIYTSSIEGEGKNQKEVFADVIRFPKMERNGKRISEEAADEIIKQGLFKKGEFL